MLLHVYGGAGKARPNRYIPGVNEPFSSFSAGWFIVRGWRVSYLPEQFFFAVM
jgi:hypothetical protein